MVDILLVGIGGFLGANARFILAGKFARRFGTGFPLGTFFINLSGSFLLGLFLAVSARAQVQTEVYRWLFAVGFCGGYTTFSTYTFETLALLRERKFTLALGVNLAGSYFGGVFLALAGAWLGSFF